MKTKKAQNVCEGNSSQWPKIRNEKMTTLRLDGFFTIHFSISLFSPRHPGLLFFVTDGMSKPRGTARAKVTRRNSQSVVTWREPETKRNLKNGDFFWTPGIILLRWSSCPWKTKYYRHTYGKKLPFCQNSKESFANYVDFQWQTCCFREVEKTHETLPNTGQSSWRWQSF